MSNLTRTFLLILSVVVFLCAAAVPTFLYLRIDRSHAELVSARANIETNASGEQEDSRIRELFNETQSSRTALDALAPKKDEAAKVITAIETAGQISDISLEVGSVNLEEKNDTFDSLRISLHSEGSFTAVIRFLKLLEVLPYASSVDSISLSAVEKGGWQMTAALSVLVHKNI